MLDKRDYIYYAYRFGKIKPKKLKWKLYCWFRKLITIKESPSKVSLYVSEGKVSFGEEKIEPKAIVRLYNGKEIERNYEYCKGHEKDI